MKIPFNIPFTSGSEKMYIQESVDFTTYLPSNKYINKCKSFIEREWEFSNIYLTTSCTAALEVCALLLNIENGDEVIIPSYTFPSTANAFLRQGAKIVLADSRNDYPGVDEKSLESLITDRTKAIVPVHYSGISCDMEIIMKVAEKYNLYVVEDAASAIDSKYNSKSLGSIGHLGCLSFHQSKNLHCIEGGAIIINDDRFKERVISILEKGTNRNEFINGNVSRYEWVGIGSSYMMSELHAAYLYAQLKTAGWIKNKRMILWNEYFNSLYPLHEKKIIRLPVIPEFAHHNAHSFYILLGNPERKEGLKSFLLKDGIQATVHYTALDRSKFWRANNISLPRINNSNIYNDCLLRLPLFNSMTIAEVNQVTTSIMTYFKIR